MLDDKKHEIRDGDCIVRIADGPLPIFGVLRAVASDGLSCGPRCLLAGQFQTHGYRCMLKLQAGKDGSICKQPRVAIAEELERLADQSSSSPSPFAHLHDALALEIREGDHSSASGSLSLLSSSSSSSSSLSSTTLPTSSLLRQRATALRSCSEPCRLSQLEMLVGVQSTCKGNARFFRASTAVPILPYHLERLPGSSDEKAPDLQKKVHLLFQRLSNGAGHWRYIDIVASSDVAYSPSYVEPKAAAVPAKQMQLTDKKSDADRSKSESGKPAGDETPKEQAEIKTNDGDFVPTNGVAVGGVARAGTMSFDSLLGVRSGVRLAVFGECPCSLSGARKRPAKSKRGSPHAQSAPLRDESRRGMRTIIGLLVVPSTKKNGLRSLQIWTVDADAHLIHHLLDEKGGTSGSASSSIPFVPPITQLPFKKINLPLLAMLSKSPPVAPSEERKAELMVMRQQWLASPLGYVKAKSGFAPSYSCSAFVCLCVVESDALFCGCVQLLDKAAKGIAPNESDKRSTGRKRGQVVLYQVGACVCLALLAHTCCCLRGPGQCFWYCAGWQSGSKA